MHGRAADRQNFRQTGDPAADGLDTVRRTEASESQQGHGGSVSWWIELALAAALIRQIIQAQFLNLSVILQTRQTAVKTLNPRSEESPS